MKVLTILTIMTALTLSTVAFASQNNDKIAVRFGDSTVERYAAEELQRYLSRVSNKQFILRDSTIKMWYPDKPTLPFPEAWAKAQKDIERRAKNPDAPDPETKNVSKKIAEREANLPAFILATPDTYPEFKDDVVKLLADVRKDSDGYVIAPSDKGDKLFIVSHTSRGVLFGVYDFLQNKCGMGFFEDGEQIPKKINVKVLPPYKTLPKKVVQTPKYDYRSKWLWSRYYGADKGHPTNWGYDEWIAHLRWMAQARFNSVLVYPVGYTRLWGDVFKRAFPEVEPFDKEVFDDEIDDFWGAHWSPRSGWGRSPEETTRLMQKVYAFAREKLGMKIEYNFYLADFEDTLKRAYPEGKWIDWSNVPHHSYFGASGRSAILAFTDPKCKEFCQRFWKEFIKTFGTDHQYWISYREESEPNPDNPFDPDRGKSLADAVNSARDWLLEIDPKAEFFHWDWHGQPVWFNKEIMEKVRAGTAHEVPVPELEESARKYVHELSNDITIVSVLPPTLLVKDLPDLTRQYEPHPWVIGSLIGYAMQDVGIGGFQTPIGNFLAAWKRWSEEDKKYNSRLRGVFHWNEIVQVAPLLDYIVADFAWSGELPNHLFNASKDDKILDWYFNHRFSKKNAKLFREANAYAYDKYQLGVMPVRNPLAFTRAGITEADEKQRVKFTYYLDKISAVKNDELYNDAYKAELLDFGRVALHTLARLDIEEAVGIAKNSKGTKEDKKKFKSVAQNALNDVNALANLLATDKKFSVTASLYRMLNEPGVNKQMRMVLLEQASGIFFDSYPLNDSAEYFKIVAAPLLKDYLKVLQLTVDDPEKFPFSEFKNVSFIDGAAVLNKANAKNTDTEEKEESGLAKRFLELKIKMMEIPAQPFSVVENKNHPANIIRTWLKKRKKLTK